MQVNLSPLLKQARQFIWRYNMTIFWVVSGGLVAFAIYMLYHVVQSASTDVSTVGVSSNFVFDKATMEKLKQLQPANSQDTYSLPTNQRSNPFME